MARRKLTFADLLTEHLNQRGMKQVELAEKAQCSQTYVSLMVRGLRRPSGKMANTLVSVFKLRGADRDAFIDAIHAD